MQFVVTIVSCVVVILVVWPLHCNGTEFAYTCGGESTPAIHRQGSCDIGVGYIVVLLHTSNYNWGKEMSFIMQGLRGR